MGIQKIWKKNQGAKSTKSNDKRQSFLKTLISSNAAMPMSTIYLISPRYWCSQFIVFCHKTEAQYLFLPDLTHYKIDRCDALDT